MLTNLHIPPSFFLGYDMDATVGCTLAVEAAMVLGCDGVRVTVILMSREET
jgi:hypothetical protein